MNFKFFNYMVPVLLGIFLLVLVMGTVSAGSLDTSSDSVIVADSVSISDVSVKDCNESVVDVDLNNCSYVDEGSYSVNNKFSSDEISAVGATKTSTKIVASNYSMYYYNGNFVVALQTSSGNALSGQKISFTFSNSSWVGVFNKTTNSSGKYGYNIKLLPGVYTCTIKFAGTSTYAASSKTVTVTVKNYTTSITASDFTKSYLDSSKFLVTLKNSSSGKALSGKLLTYTFTNGTWTGVYNKTTNSNGQYNYTIGLAPGIYNCTIKFAGEKGQASCSKKVKLTIKEWPSKLIVSDVNVYGNDESIVVTLRNNSNVNIVNKSIKCTINGVTYTQKTNSNGQAIFSVPDLSPGEYNATIKFTDKSYSDCSKTIKVVVEKLPINIIYSNLSLLYKSDNKVIINLQDNKGNEVINQSLIFRINDSDYLYVTDSFGNVSVSVPNLSPGIYLSTIEYEGNEIYSSFSENFNISINKLPTKIVANDFDIHYNDDGILFATLQDSEGRGIANKSLIFRINDSDYVCITDSFGNASLSVPNLDPGVYCCVIRFDGDDINNSCTKILNISFKSNSYLFINLNSSDYFSILDIINTSKNLNKFIVENNYIPNIININENSYSIDEFTYLMAKTIYNLNCNDFSDIYLPVIKNNNKADFFTDINLSHINYESVVNSIIYSVEDNCHIPSNISILLNNISFTSCVFGFTEILSYFKMTNRLPQRIHFTSYNLSNDSCLLKDYSYNSSKYSNNQVIFGNTIDIYLVGSNSKLMYNKSVIVTVSNGSFSKEVIINTSSDGVIKLNANWGLGEYNISCLFRGDEIFNDSRYYCSINITQMPTKLLINKNSILVNDVLKISLLDYNGRILSNQSVLLVINNDTYHLVTDYSGNIYWDINESSTNFLMSCYFCGNELYCSSLCSTQIFVKNKTKCTAKDIITHNNTTFEVIIDNYNTYLNNASLNYKILDTNFNLITFGTVNITSGKANIPILLNSGDYIIFYELGETDNYLESYGMNYLEVVPDDFKISTNLNIINDKCIYYKDDLIRGQLLDSLNNPIPYSRVSLTFINQNNLTQEKYELLFGSEKFLWEDLNSKYTTYYLTTDSNGTFKTKVSFEKGSNWLVVYKFEGNEYYERFATFGILNMSYGYNLEYLFYIPINYNITVNNKKISVPYGREIGIYKNNKTYKLSYGYSSSNCTQMSDNVAYFISLNDNKGIHLLNKTVYNENLPGFYIKSDSNRLSVIYLGYFTEDINQFSVVFDGRKINGKYSSYISFIYNNKVVASMYFSSKIYTNNTKSSIYKQTNKSCSNFIIYGADSIRTYFLITNETSTTLHRGRESVEHLYYGDLSYDNPLKKSGWNSSVHYEAVQSHLFTSSKITDSDYHSFLSKASNSSSTKSIAYNAFLYSLTLNYLEDQLCNDLADYYDVSWSRDGYNLITTFFNDKGCSIDSNYHADVSGGCWDNRFYFNYYEGMYASLLEEYVMELSGYDATCGVSEVNSAIQMGEFFIDKRGNNLTISNLDNTSYLEITLDSGFVGSIIYYDVQSKYDGAILHGGILKTFGNWGNYALNILTPNRLKFANSAASAVTGILTGFELISVPGLCPVTALFSAGPLSYEARNNFASPKQYQYFTYHPSYDVKVVSVKNSVTGYIDYVEIPYKGDSWELDRNRAIYIDSKYGKRNLTVEETYKYIK